MAFSACDTLRPPIIHNGVAGSIQVRAAWSDGTESTGSIEPREVSHLGRSDARLETITVSRDGAKIVELGESEISALSDREAAGVVGMSIADDGPRDLTREELKRVRSSK